ncbi:hypothetical protein Tco_1131577 [Tanacetum coccineum]
MILALKRCPQSKRRQKSKATLDSAHGGFNLNIETDDLDAEEEEVRSGKTKAFISPIQIEYASGQDVGRLEDTSSKMSWRLIVHMPEGVL